MAAETAEQRRQGFINITRRAYGKDPTEQDIQAFLARPDISLEQREREFLSSADFANLQGERARLERAPELENIELGQEMAKQQAELSKQQLDLSKSTLEGDIAESIRRIKKNQLEQQSNFLNQQQRLGIRPSGITQTGLGELGIETGISLNRLEAQRANQLAQMALNQSGVEQTLASAVRQGTIARAGIEQNIGDRKQQLLDAAQSSFENAIRTNDKESFDRAMKLIRLAQDTPEGTTLDLGEYGQVEGTKYVAPPKIDTQVVSVGNRQVLIESETGKIIQDLGEVSRAPRIGSSSRKTTQIGGSNFRSAYNEGVAILEDIDTRTQSNRDRIFDQGELQDAQAEIERIANLYGVDANELWNQIVGDLGFQEYDPSMTEFPTFGRISKQKSGSSGGDLASPY